MIRRHNSEHTTEAQIGAAWPWHGGLDVLNGHIQAPAFPRSPHQLECPPPASFHPLTFSSSRKALEQAELGQHRGGLPSIHSSTSLSMQLPASAQHTLHRLKVGGWIVLLDNFTFSETKHFLGGKRIRKILKNSTKL